MVHAVRRIFPAPGTLRQDQSRRLKERLARTLDGFQGNTDERVILERAVALAADTVSRSTASAVEERFFMLYPSQNRFVIDELSLHSRWPKVATRVWAHVLEHVDRDYEILVTREGLTERVGAKARAVDGVLAELVKIGALTRQRVPEPGKQGRGTVQYFLNPRVGFKDRPAGQNSADRQEAPALRVIEGSQTK